MLRGHTSELVTGFAVNPGFPRISQCGRSVFLSAFGGVQLIIRPLSCSRISVYTRACHYVNFEQRGASSITTNFIPKQGGDPLPRLHPIKSRVELRDLTQDRKITI